MSSIEIRPFRRADRDQLAALVNAHVQAVVPGLAVPVNAVLSQLEREPDEFVVDPWVVERATLVAVARERIVAAALLHRYGTGADVGEDFRASGEIRWLLCRPEQVEAGDLLAAACLAQLGRWGVRRRYADGGLPAPGVFGLPAQWTHVRAVLERAGFVHDGTTEVVLLADVDRLPVPDPPLPSLVARRSVGVNGVRISGWVEGHVRGFVELDTDLADAGRLGRLQGWADIGNLHVDAGFRRRGVATWLYGQAAQWLRLARVDRLLDYAGEDETDRLALCHRLGFVELTRTARGWVHRS